MAKVKQVSYGAYQPTQTKYAEFFNSFNCPLMSVSTASTKKCIVLIDNTLTATFDLEPASAQSSTFQSIIMTYNGVSTRYASECVVARGTNILCACSDYFVYIDHWDGWGNHFEIVYDKVGGENFYGWRDSGTSPSILNMNFINTKSAITYNLRNRLNTTDVLDTITYAQAVLKRSDIKSINDTNFICCTSVPSGKVITIDNDGTYYSLNSNIIVPYEV